MVCIEPTLAGLICGILAVCSATVMMYGLGRLERAYPRVAGKLNRIERERFLHALARCRKAFMIAGFGLCLLEAAVIGILAFGPGEWRNAAGMASAISALLVGYFFLLVSQRNTQLDAFLERVEQADCEKH